MILMMKRGQVWPGKERKQATVVSTQRSGHGREILEARMMKRREGRGRKEKSDGGRKRDKEGGKRERRNNDQAVSVGLSFIFVLVFCISLFYSEVVNLFH